MGATVGDIMADSDKNIVIKPNVGSSTSFPEIKFTGKDNVPFYLHVLDDGTVSFSGRQGEVFSISETLTTGDIFAVADISGIRRMAVNASGAVDVFLNASQPFKVSSSNTERFRVHPDGNVGINDSAPDKELSIIGIGGGNADVDVARTGGATINLQAQSAAGIIGTTTNHNLQFKTNGSVRMTVEPGGDVGMGITNPTHTLHVQSADEQLALFKSTDAGAGIRIDSPDDGYSVVFFSEDGTNKWSLGKLANNSDKFSIYDEVNTTPRLVIDTSGNIGINETSPSTKLDVNGTISSTGHRGFRPFFFEMKKHASSDNTNRQDLSTTSTTTITWHVANSNNDNAHYTWSSGTNSRIYVDKDGFYLCNWNIVWSNTNSGAQRATLVGSIYKNGSQILNSKAFGYSRGDIYGDFNHCGGSYGMFLDDGDYIEIKIKGVDFDDGTDPVWTLSRQCSVQMLGWPDRGE